MMQAILVTIAFWIEWIGWHTCLTSADRSPIRGAHMSRLPVIVRHVRGRSSKIVLKPKSYRCDKVPGSVNGNIKIALESLRCGTFYPQLMNFGGLCVFSIQEQWYPYPPWRQNEHGKRSVNEKEWNITYIPQLYYTSMDFNTSELNGPIGLES